MTTINAQKILCNLGYENMDKLILESLETAFNNKNYKFGAFSIFDGYISLNKYNFEECKENPLIEFVYSPINQVVTIDNLRNYDVKNIIIENINLSKIVNIEDELTIRRMKKEVGGIRDMFIEYILMNDELKEQIIKYIEKSI